MIVGLSLSGTAALIEAGLATSDHVSPGPWVKRVRRRRGEESRRARCEKRYHRKRDTMGAAVEGVVGMKRFEGKAVRL